LKVEIWVVVLDVLEFHVECHRIIGYQGLGVYLIIHRLTVVILKEVLFLLYWLINRKRE